jgi:hypothetical protein
MNTTDTIRWSVIGAALLALASCTTHGKPDEQSASPTPSANTKTFVSHRYDIRLNYPANLELHHDFKHGYLDNGSWKTYVGPDSPDGTPLVALVMPQSNDVTSGALRIGVSRKPRALETCTDLPQAARPKTQGTTTVSGVPFTTFKAADAAMSHYLSVRSFRAVHNGTCYAVDVLVYGTNPKVYSPPRTPPFTKSDVFARLVPVVKGLKFIQPTLPTPATYTGELPCADCPGIDYQLNLLDDHAYAMRMIYRDRDTHFDERGHWRLSDDGTTLTLQPDKGQGRKWAVKNNGRGLRMLNRSGEPPPSGLDYKLTRDGEFSRLPDRYHQ